MQYHTSDMDAKINGILIRCPWSYSTRIVLEEALMVLGFFPGIPKSRDSVESLMRKAFANLTGDLAGTTITGMEEVRQQLVDDHFSSYQVIRT